MSDHQSRDSENSMLPPPNELDIMESNLMPPPPHPCDEDCFKMTRTDTNLAAGDHQTKRLKINPSSNQAETSSESASNQALHSGYSDRSDIPPEGAVEMTRDDTFIPFTDLIKCLHADLKSTDDMYLEHFDSSVSMEQQCEELLDRHIESAMAYERDLISQKEKLLARLGGLHQTLKPDV